VSPQGVSPTAEDSGTVVGCHVFNTGCDSDIDFTGFDLVGDLIISPARAPSEAKV